MAKNILLSLVMFYLTSYAQTTEMDTLIYDKEDLLEEISNEEAPIDELFEKPMLKQGETLLSRPNIEIRSRFRRQLPISRGYKENVYLGNPWYSYQRIKVGNQIAEGGLLLKKDAGEKSYSDFTNYYFQLNDIFKFKKFIIGDYIIEAGQGLFFWRGYYYSKGVGFSETAIRKARELQAYNSSDELGFMRGFATQLDLNFLSILIFYSKRNLTASIDTNGFINNFYFTYFRTQSDLAGKNNTGEKIYGSRIYMSRANYKIGFTITENIYSRVIQNVQKNRYVNMGLDMLFNYQSINVAFESYLNNMRNLNSIFAIKFQPVKNMNYLLLYRSYSVSTFNRFSNPFGEYSGGKSENGFFTGMKWKLNKYLLITAYADKYTIPFSESYNFSVNCSEYFIQINNNLSNGIDFYIRYRSKIFEEKKQIFDDLNRTTKINEVFEKENFRFHLNYKILKKVIYKFRAEYLILSSKYTSTREYGRMFYHDIGLDFLFETSVNFRITFFSSSSYKSGISSYESDLDGVLTNPILYGKGLKWYLLVKYKIKNLLLLSIKYSYLIRDDVKKIGTGWEQLPANYDDRIGLQLEMNL